MRQKAQGKARMPTGRGRGGAAQEQHAAGGRGVAAQEHHGAGGFVGKRTEVLRRVRQMAREMVRRRESWVTRWKAIRDFELPYIGVFDGEEDISSRALRRDRHIYHGCAWQANQVFAAGVMSGLTPPSRRWFRLNFGRAEVASDTDVGRLLDQRIDIMNEVLEKSNFYTAVHSCYLELAFGQAPLAIFPDAKYGVRFEPYTVGTYAMECGADGTVDTFCTRFTMTAVQLAEKFGIDVLPDRVKSELTRGTGVSNQYKVVWFVARNPCANPERMGRQYLPFLSVYYLEDSGPDEVLYVGGFHEFPVVVARYQITGTEPYGKGPGTFAEGDAKSLQHMEKDYLTAVELAVKPPMTTTADNATKGVSLVPGGKTYVQQVDGVKPLFQVQMDLPALQQKIVDLEDRIKRAYSADLFLLLDQMEDKSMTAREVVERTQEKMQQLGPVVQRMQFEFLGRLIERVYNILDRAHVFPEPEDEELAATLAQEEIKIEYISPLAQAQKMGGLVNIEQAVGFLFQMAQADPMILQKLDTSETVNRYFEMVGAPAAIKRSDEEYEQIVEAQKQAQAQKEQETQAAQMVQMAAPAAQAAKNATEAAADGNPALQQLMGMDNMGAPQAAQ